MHELTFSCYRRMPLLEDDDRRQLLARGLDEALQRHKWRLAAFVFMPEHVHLLTYPFGTEADVAALLQAIKKPFSFRVKERLSAEGDPLLADLMVRERPGVTRFRFWLEGPGYDRNLSSRDAILAAIDYIHMNPVRRRLCERAVEWKWSSARRYLLPEEPFDPELPMVHGMPEGI